MSFLERFFFFDCGIDDPDFDFEQIHDYVYEDEDDEL